MRGFSSAAAASNSGGARSMSVAPGGCILYRVARISGDSLLTTRRVFLSISRGAVQRPRYPGLAWSYTCLQAKTIAFCLACEASATHLMPRPLLDRAKGQAPKTLLQSMYVQCHVRSLALTIHSLICPLNFVPDYETVSHHPRRPSVPCISHS